MPNAGFREIANYMREQISSGAAGWHAGNPLPSEAELRAEWGVTRTTIRRALKVLEDEGRIEVVQGRGRFVAGSRTPTAAYELIAASIREEISQMPPGARLDRETDLAEWFAVALGTIRQALGLLEAEGSIYAAHGQGWFVGQPHIPDSRTDEVTKAIRSAIESGSISPGEFLPGERTLAEQHGVGRITARRALIKLEEAGLVEKQAGKRRVVAGLTAERKEDRRTGG